MPNYKVGDQIAVLAYQAIVLGDPYTYDERPVSWLYTVRRDSDKYTTDVGTFLVVDCPKHNSNENREHLCVLTKIADRPPGEWRPQSIWRME